MPFFKEAILLREREEQKKGGGCSIIIYLFIHARDAGFRRSILIVIECGNSG